MTDTMLKAITIVVSMVTKSGYRWDEALSYAEVEYGFDEFQLDDLQSLSRNQIARLRAQGVAI